jgi:hypothetical protein
MGTIATQVSIIDKVSDMVYIDILNQKLQHASFEYVILNGEKKIVRKGNFRAPSVQLRTNHLEEGMYQFQLLLNGKLWETTDFRKRKDEFALA